MRGRKSAFLFFMGIAVLAFQSVACSLMAGMDHDRVLDQNVTDLARSYESFFKVLIDSPNSAAAEYDADAEFYENAFAVLKALMIREEARGNTDKYLRSLNEIHQATKEMEELHKNKSFKPDQPAAFKNRIDKEFKKLIKEQKLVWEL